jgi:uncharacterized membrane protein
MSFSEMLSIGGGVLVIGLAVFLIVVAVLWILMPIAVVGIKRRLDRLIDCTEETNLLLRGLTIRTPDNSGNSSIKK